MAIRSNQRVVVGVDGSEGSRSALRWAVEEAKFRGAAITVLLAYDLPLWQYYMPITRPPLADVEAAARRTLDSMVEAAGGEGLAIEAEFVQDKPAGALITASLDADLLVVGSRGQGWFGGALLGSVSLHCVQHAACPVVVVRTNAPAAE